MPRMVGLKVSVAVPAAVLKVPECRELWLAEVMVRAHRRPHH